ncbi:MAG: uracil-DNA glycosylase [Candidatus Woesearchaeota archaeon]|jgi:DNA polymerase
MSLEQLKQQYHDCKKCSELCKSRSQVVFGSGNHNSKILFIGEAPGATEDKQGIPFCGMSGKILSELLAHIGVTRDEVFITNTILCHPQDNRNPAKEEVQNCRERLDKMIEIMQPKVIVTIGNFATERILNKTGITTLRGKVYPTIINNKEVKVVPVIHPAGYLYSGRNPEMLKQMKADFEAIAKVIDDKKQQKSLVEF